LLTETRAIVRAIKPAGALDQFVSRKFPNAGRSVAGASAAEKQTIAKAVTIILIMWARPLPDICPGSATLACAFPRPQDHARVGQSNVLENERQSRNCPALKVENTTHRHVMIAETHIGIVPCQ
jgi:hypothetical protein